MELPVSHRFTDGRSIETPFGLLQTIRIKDYTPASHPTIKNRVGTPNMKVLTRKKRLERVPARKNLALTRVLEIGAPIG